MVRSDGRLHTVNERWSQILGRDADSIMAEPLSFMVHADDRAIVERALANLVGGRDLTRFKVRLMDGEGLARWTDWNITTDREGQLYCAVRDVDEEWRRQEELENTRKSAEEAKAVSAEAEHLLVEAIEALPDGFIIYDADDKVVRYNEKYREYFSYMPPVAEGLGLSFTDIIRMGLDAGFYADEKSRLDPEGWIADMAALHSGETSSSYEMKTSDDRYIRIVDQPMGASWKVGIRSDITEVKRAEANLRDGIESLNDGFILFDADDRIVICNSAYRTGYKHLADQVVEGLHYSDLMRLLMQADPIDEFKGREQEWVDSEVARHRTGGLPLEFLTETGEYFRISKRETSNGGIVAVRSDITALKKAETRLLHAIESMRGGFCLFDADGVLVLANSAFKSYYGDRSADVYEGMPLADLCRVAIEVGVGGAEGVDPEAWIQERLARHGTANSDREHVFADGRTFAISERMTVEGGTVVVFSDTTEVKKAERRLRDAVESLTDGFVFFDENDQLAVYNTSWSEGFGPLADQLRVGLTYEESIRLLAESGMIPETEGRVEEWVAEQVKNYGKEPDFERAFENGRVVRVSRRLTEEGGSVAIRADITAIRQAEARLTDAIESLNDGFLLWDSDDRLVKFNQTYITYNPEFADQVCIGMSFEELAGFVYDVRVGPVERNAAARKKWISGRLEAHLNPSSSLEQLHTDGSVFRMTERRTREGGIVMITSDVTDIKRAGDYLRDAIETIQDGFILCDAEDRIVVTNSAFREGIDIPAHFFEPGTTFEDMTRAMSAVGGRRQRRRDRSRGTMAGRTYGKTSQSDRCTGDPENRRSAHDDHRTPHVGWRYRCGENRYFGVEGQGRRA